MVAADNPTASRIGAQVLADGGDAVDAAVATAIALGVLQPFASGIGGGGFAVVHRKNNKDFALDFREVAPSKAHRDMYLDKNGSVIPKASTIGPPAAAVPGELAGLFELHRRHGKLPWSRLIAPSVSLAVDGFPCNKILHKKIKRYRALIAERPALAEVFLKNGKPIGIGETIRRPRFGQTLKTIAAKGAQAFYRGDIARALSDAMTQDGGLIRFSDLANYKPKERRLVRAHAFGHEFLSMPPPSSGGAVLIQVLKVLDTPEMKTLAWNSVPYIHRVVEAMKHGFADRANVMGDPDFTPVPLKALIGDVNRDRIRSAFKPLKTLENKRYGGKYASPSDGGTSHFSVLDKHGNAVALTTTVNTGFGSLYVAGDTGIILNNEMDDFVAKPGVPNAFGLVGRAANAIEAGKRPLSSMSPTVVLKDGKVRMVVGASGGPTIITGTLQAVLNVLLFGKPAHQAVLGARFHHQWQPDIIFMEIGAAPDVLAGLTKKGHTVKVRPRYNSVQMIKVDGKVMTGASDPSKHGRPAGVGEARKIIQ